MSTDELALRRARALGLGGGGGPQRFAFPHAPPAAELRRYQTAWIERAVSLLEVHAARAGADMGPPEEVAARLRRHAAALASLRATMRPPLDRYCDRMGVDACDRDALALVAAPHLDPAARDLVVRLRGAARSHVDVGFVAAILGDSRGDALALARRLGRDGVLAQSGLVAYSSRRNGPQVFELDRDMTPTARLLGLLDGEIRLNTDVADGALLLPTGARDADGVLPGGAEHPDLALAALVCGADAGARSPCVLVTGPRGVGKHGVASALAALAGQAFVLRVDHAVLPRAPAELGARLHELSREAAQVGALLVVAHVRCDAASADALRLALRGARVPVVLTADACDGDLLQGVAAVRIGVSRPDASLRAAAWRVELARAKVTVPELDVRRLAADVPVARPAIATALALARPAPGLATIERCARAQSWSQLGRYAERSRTLARLTDLVLPDDGADQVAEIISAYRNRPLAQARWGGHLTLGTGFIVLLNGPPGTGKSLTAAVIAAELGLPLFRIDVSRIFDRYVGETEKNLVRLFEEAAADRAALLFDEADSLFSRRVDVKDASDRHANTQVNVLLERIERHEGLVLLTTNLKGAIDEALLRRITYKLELRRPDAREREALWRTHVPEAARATDVDFRALAAEFRASGADIRNAVTRALLAAGDAPVTHELLRRSAQGELEAAGGVVCR